MLKSLEIHLYILKLYCILSQLSKSHRYFANLLGQRYKNKSSCFTEPFPEGTKSQVNYKLDINFAKVTLSSEIDVQLEMCIFNIKKNLVLLELENNII